MFLCASIFCLTEQTISHLSKILNRFKHCVYSVCTCVLWIEWEIISNRWQHRCRAQHSSIHVCDMYGVCTLMFALRILKNNGLNSSSFFCSHPCAHDPFTLRLFRMTKESILLLHAIVFNFTRTFRGERKKDKIEIKWNGVRIYTHMCKHQIENKLKRDEDRNRDQPFQSGLCQHNKYSINTSPSLSHSLCMWRWSIKKCLEKNECCTDINMTNRWKWREK